ncbi:efflux RND transporter permease subunit [Bacillus solitudinis]|uniref:efflux RND transporter permease subunit n=1 Tax=Bacillus solitudinis TaxID=2014074 RepID=UPI000C23D008|nr:efflux RND transporter permease subunit [Bacillus solitudinis]
MSLLNFLLERKLIVGLLVVFVLAIGLYSTTKLDQELMPPITMDGAAIQVEAGDMGALDVEQRITEPIEQTLEGIDGIISFESTSSIGHSSLSVQLEEGRGDDVFKEMESQLNELKPQLTEIKDMSVNQYSLDNPYEFFMDISAGNKESMTEFGKVVLEKRLEALPEVRDVALVGIDEKEMVIELKQAKLSEWGINPTDVITTIQQTNTEVAIGELVGEENEPTLRWNTTFQDVDDLKSIQIETLTGRKTLNELATVSELSSQQTAGAWKNGTADFILVQIGRVPNVTQIEMATAVRAEVEAIKKEGLVSGFELDEVVAQADYVRDSIDGVSKNVLVGGVIAIVILLLFLRNVRATLIIGLAIPISILLTFAAMWFFDYSFNMLSLIGLGLGIGMMVDASIVILESIYQKREQGFEKLDAVLQGTKEVATAVLASMLTTIVVFLPIGILGGEMGKFMIILSVVVCITLISSVLISFTLIPTLAHNFLKTKVKQQRPDGFIVTIYGRLISWIGQKKRNRYGVITVFLLVFIGSLLLITKIPMTIMPDVFNRYAEISIQLESGVTPAEREDIAIAANKQLSAVPDVTNNIILDSVGAMYVLVNMTAEDEATLEQKEVNEQILSSLRKLENQYPIVSIGSAMDGGGGLPITLEVTGESFSILTDVASDLTKQLSDIEGIVSITTSTEKLSPEHDIVLNEQKMEEDQLSSQFLLQQMNQMFSRIPVGDMSALDNQPIVITSDVSVENELEFLSAKILLPSGQTEKLSKYIELKPTVVPTQIDRKKGERVVTVMADIENRDLGSINREITELLNGYNPPNGYSVSTAGDLEAQQKAVQEMAMILGISLFLVYVVMAIQFNSLKHPLIVMSIIPFTITGVIIGLLLTQQEMSVMAGMGVIMLIGIVLNNAILLIDRTKQLRNENVSLVEAVVTAGKTRLRPIFMTTLTTIGGMLPLALATGTASGYQAPMATVVISGLLFATVITLVLIPAIYLLFEDISRGFQKLIRRDKSKLTVEKAA